MAYTQIEVSRRDAVAIVTLNRPEKLNAWTPRMAEEQAHAIAAANDDPSIGAIVTTGAGRGFCAGADMEATFGARLSGTDPGHNTDAGFGGMPEGLDWVSLCRASKPMVAAVNGPAVGIGLTMCLPMDQIVAAAGAKIGTGFIRMGLVPELASTRLMVERCGVGPTNDLFLSGRVVSAEEAHALRLVDRVVPADELLDTAVAIAASYAANPDLQLRMVKELLTVNAVESDLTTVQRREQEMLRRCWASPEHAEAVAAFVEKRPPRFRP